MSKRYFLGANWKMHGVPAGALEHDSPYHDGINADIVVFPSALDLDACINATLTCGGQYARCEQDGAFTGDVCMSMLKEHGASYVLCGHSERRTLHGETDEMVAAQVSQAVSLGLTPVLCIGETLSERTKNETQAVLKRQLSAVTLPSNAIVAYEPVWAIGSGKTPSPQDVEETHAFIRSLLKKTSVRILYGGSITAKNAASFFALPDVDGGLIGGASLKPEEFRGIVEATH